MILAILISICIERLINPGLFLQRFNWFSNYLAYLQIKLPQPVIWRGLVGIIVIILPLVTMTGIVYYLIAEYTSELLKELVTIVILVYCLGPGDTRRQVEAYIAAVTEKDNERTTHYVTSLFPSTGQVDNIERGRAISLLATSRFNEEIFAVLFWFTLLGPVGALLYRLSLLIEQHADNTAQPLHHHAKLFRAVLDWLPIRLLGFSFTLVGNFTESFNFLRRSIFSGINNNQFFLQTIGIIAVGNDPADASQATIKENKALLGLFDRTIIIWLVAIALLTLAAWVY